MNGLGRLLITLGLLIAIIGVIISIAPRIPWLGKLPGDFYIKKENFSFYFPLGTCLLLSALLSFILWLFRR
ncbi:MAG TPA: DUF2905 domain-containing protein [Desulfuromonadaceae bacterium]|jgi:hypothetical protein